MSRAKKAPVEVEFDASAMIDGQPYFAHHDGVALNRPQWIEATGYVAKRQAELLERALSAEVEEGWGDLIHGDPS